MRTLGLLDYSTILVYMGLMAGIGIYLGKFVKDIGAYFKGGGTLPWVAAGISNFMSLFSAFVFVAYAGIAYEHGLVALTVIWCTIPPCLAVAYIFAKRWRRANIMTPVEYLESRFNNSIRQFFSWGGIALRILDNMVRLYAIGVFIAAATPMTLETSILVAGLIVIIYTVVGGLWAVVLTDTVQFIVLIFTSIILVPLSLESVGGFSNVVNEIPKHFTFFNGPKGALLFLVAYYVMVLIKYNGNWSFIQRFYSVRDENAGRKVGLLTAGLFLVFPFFFLLPAVVANVAVPGLDNPEMAYVSIALEVLPEGVMGLMMAAMFAATMSALDSEFNVTASVFTRDIYQRIINPGASDKKLMLVGRSATIAIGGLVILGALFVGLLGGAFEANKLLTGLFAIPFAIPLIIGILTPNPRPWGVLATVVVGVATGLYFNFHPEVSWEIATLIVIAICIITMYLSGFVASKNQAYLDRVDNFFIYLSEPVKEKDKPSIEPKFKRSLILLLAIALFCAGILFVLTSLPTIYLFEMGGMLAFGMGVLCMILATLFYRWNKKLMNGEDKTLNKQITDDL